MYISCSAVNCCNCYGEKPGLGFFRFPSLPVEKVDRCRKKKRLMLSKHSRIYGEHFISCNSGICARDHRLLKHNMNIFSIIYVPPSFRKANKYSQRRGLCPITINFVYTKWPEPEIRVYQKEEHQKRVGERRRVAEAAELDKENQRDLTNLFDHEDSEES